MSAASLVFALAQTNLLVFDLLEVSSANELLIGSE